MSKPSLAHRLIAVAVAATMLLSAAACSDDETSTSPTSTRRPSDAPSTRQPALEGTILVVAADTFTDALPEAIELFRELNPGVEVTVRFDVTSVLAMELLDGAPADVFISADESNMTALSEGGRLDGPPRVLALNDLVIVTAARNSSGTIGLRDLASVGPVALCESSTPCGALADEALGSGLADLDVDRTANGRAAVDAVVSGDAGAALVLAADAAAAGDAVATSTPERPFRIRSTVATLTPGDNELAARAFVDFLRSPDGVDILVDHGFGAPT